MYKYNIGQKIKRSHIMPNPLNINNKSNSNSNKSNSNPNSNSNNNNNSKSNINSKNKSNNSNPNNRLLVSYNIEDTDSNNFIDMEVNINNISHILPKVNSIKMNIGEVDVVFYKKNMKESHTSLYFVDSNNKYFMKIPYMYKEFDILRREIFILKKLENYDCFPKIVYYNNILLVTEYIGDVITKDTIPDNILFQINYISNILLKEKIIHSDIKKYEMLIRDDKLYIIDFGWARYNNKWSCDNGLCNRTKPDLDNTSDIQSMINVIIGLLNSK